MPLRAILFDLWGTLIVDSRERSGARQAWRTANVHRALTRCGCDVELEAVDAALLRLIRTIGSLQDTGKDPGGPGRVELFFELLGEPSTAFVTEAGRGEVLEAIGGLRVDHAPVLAPGATEALSALKGAGLRTGLVSNAGVTTAPDLRRLLDYYGLEPYLDTIVFSDEFRLAKPDPGIFLHALAVLGTKEGASAFVGDAPHNDIAGAQAAGLFAIQIGNKSLDGVEPQARLDTLAELIGVLREQSLLPGVTARYRR